MFTKTREPLLVVVKDGRYACYGPDTFRSACLMHALWNLGGINSAVPDGRYHFNYKRVWFMKANVTLDRIDD